MYNAANNPPSRTTATAIDLLLKQRTPKNLVEFPSNRYNKGAAHPGANMAH